METMISDTHNLEPDSPIFYLKLRQAEDIFIERIRNNSQFIVIHYYDYISTYLPEKDIIKDELYIEFLYLGVYIKVYSARALTCPPFWIKISRRLNNWRKNRPNLKFLIDLLRDIVFRKMNSTKEIKTLRYNPLLSLEVLINWMEASGKFNAEIIKMKQWYVFLQSLSIDRANAIINRSLEHSTLFESICDEHFGTRIYGINERLSTARGKPLGGDIFLDEKVENMYHMHYLRMQV